MDVKMTRIRESDLEIVMNWRMQPDVTKYMNTDPVLTIDHQIEWFNRIKNSNTQINWIINYNNIPIGLINIENIDKVNLKCSWGYYIAVKSARSFKLATYLEWNLYDYVFKVLGLHKLYCETFIENKQVVKLHILCGGQEEGIMRHHIFKNGIYHDVSIVSILDYEWDEKSKDLKYERFVFE